MKALPLLLGLSLAANAALGVILLLRAAPAPSHSPTARAPAPASSPPDLEARAAAASALSAAAQSGDAESLRDQLRALGVPEDVIRSAVHALLYRSFADLQKQFLQESKDAKAYWRPSAGYFGLDKMNREQRMKLRRANLDVMRRTEELVGPDPDDPLVARYSFLSEEKAAKMRALERDYSEIRGQLYHDQEGFRVPSDAEKIAYLEKEQRKDIEALLSPEELQAYDLRSSSTAQRVRQQMRDFEATEEEYKAIYALQKSFDDRMILRSSESNPLESGAARPVSPEEAKARTEAQQQYQAELRATLGEARYEQYLRSQNPDYRALSAAAKRFNLPPTTVDEVYSVRNQAVTEAERLSRDPSLSPEQRSQALTALANRTRGQVQQKLGGEIADSYLRNSMRWLDTLQRGLPIVNQPDGSVRPAPSALRAPGPTPRGD